MVSTGGERERTIRKGEMRREGDGIVPGVTSKTGYVTMAELDSLGSICTSAMSRYERPWGKGADGKGREGGGRKGKGDIEEENGRDRRELGGRERAPEEREESILRQEQFGWSL